MEKKKKLSTVIRGSEKMECPYGSNSYSFKIYHSYFQGFLAALIKIKSQAAIPYWVSKMFQVCDSIRNTEVLHQD